MMRNPVDEVVGCGEESRRQDCRRAAQDCVRHTHPGSGPER